MTSTLLLIAVTVILALTLAVVRQARRRQSRLEQDNRIMQTELDRHRQAVQSILREFQNL